MITEQLLSYIRDNMKAGHGRADIEVALRAAGWDAPDIAAAFTALQNGSSAPATMAMPRAASPGSAQADVNAELVRIQAELKTRGRSTLAGQQSTETGIIGWMIKHKMVSSRKQANLFLVTMSVISIGLIVWINFG